MIGWRILWCRLFYSIPGLSFTARHWTGPPCSCGLWFAFLEGLQQGRWYGFFTGADRFSTSTVLRNRKAVIPIQLFIPLFEKSAMKRKSDSTVRRKQSIWCFYGCYHWSTFLYVRRWYDTAFEDMALWRCEYGQHRFLYAHWSGHQDHESRRAENCTGDKKISIVPALCDVIFFFDGNHCEHHCVAGS